jgi:hypothetical protein
VKSFIIFFVIFGASFFSQASGQSKYRQECALTSNTFKDKLPSAFITVWCANDKRADFGKMGPDVVHAMAAAVFYEKRMDRRTAALNLLESYECSKKSDCIEFLYLLDWGIKSNQLAKYNKSLATRTGLLREKVSAKLKALNKLNEDL